MLDEFDERPRAAGQPVERPSPRRLRPGQPRALVRVPGAVRGRPGAGAAPAACGRRCPPVLADQFDLADVELEPDRFAAASATTSTAPGRRTRPRRPVRVMFESGIGANEVGEPGGTFELGLDVVARRRRPRRPPCTSGADETLSARGARRARPAGSTPSGSTRRPAARRCSAAPASTRCSTRLWDIDWTRFDPGEELSYLTAPFDAGHGVRRARLRPACSWPPTPRRRARAGVGVGGAAGRHRVPDPERLARPGPPGRGPAPQRRARDRAPVHRGRPAPADAGASSSRPGSTSRRSPTRSGPGSQLRLSVATPGRNHATWEFENPDYGGAVPTQPGGPHGAHAVGAGAVDARRRRRCRPCRRPRAPACGARRAGPSSPPRTRRAEPRPARLVGAGTTGPYHGAVSTAPSADRTSRGRRWS